MRPGADPLFDMAGRIVVVAGAGGGLGTAICRMLGERGANLVLFDNDESRLQAFVDSVDFPLRCLVADITTETDNERVLECASQEFGGVDAVVNATGLLPISPSEFLPESEFRRCLDVNVTGAWLLSRAAARRMGARGGAIVHLASVSSKVSNADYAAYAGSKAALAQIVRVLAREWASRGIRVNAVGPALTDTPLTHDYLSSPEFRKNAVAAIPLGRLGTPEDLLATVLLLCSPGGAFITGQTIYVDGGRTLV